MYGLIATYILTYGGAVAALRYPLVGMYIYALFSVVRPHRIFGWAGDLYGMSLIVGVAMLIGWALNGFGSWNFGRAKPIVLLLLGFFGWFCLSAVFASSQEVAWASVQERAKVVLPFLVGITMMNSETAVRRFAWMLVLANGYLGYEMNASYVFDGYNRAHAEGLLGDNNSFAIQMVASVGPALFLGFSSPEWWKKGLAFGSAVLILHTVLLTFSRGGILALMITGVVVLVVMPKRPAYLLAIVVAGLLTARLMGPQVTERFMTTFAEEEARDGSASSRTQLWRDCLTIMGRSPLVGVGPRHFPRVASEFGWPHGKEAHSLWMQLGAECGPPALLLLLAFYGVAMLKGLSLMWTERNTEAAVHGLYVFSGLAGFIVAAQFVTMEGLELPYFIVLVGAATLKLLSLRDERVAQRQAAETAGPGSAAPGFAGAALGSTR